MVTLTPVLSRREEARRLGVDFDAGVAGQTALSGLQTKPPALAEVHDRDINHFLYRLSMKPF